MRMINEEHPSGSDEADASAYGTSDRILAQERLLREEAEHRFGNFLQLVASNLDHDARRATDDDARMAIEVATRQLQALAGFQRALTEAPGQFEVDCQSKLATVCSMLEQLVTAPRGHALRFVSEDEVLGLTLRPDLARCVTLLVTELVINAVKHAFPAGAKGRIQVVLARTADRMSCTVLDNGTVAPVPNTGVSESRGMKLVQRLAEQFGGRCHWVFSRDGTRACVDLPLVPRGATSSKGSNGATGGRYRGLLPRLRWLSRQHRAT